MSGPLQFQIQGKRYNVRQLDASEALDALNALNILLAQKDATVELIMGAFLGIVGKMTDAPRSVLDKLNLRQLQGICEMAGLTVSEAKR